MPYLSLHHTFVMVEQCLSQHGGGGGFDGTGFRVVGELADFEQLIGVRRMTAKVFQLLIVQLCQDLCFTLIRSAAEASQATVLNHRIDGA